MLDVPHLDAKVKLRTLIAGGSFSIHDLRAPVGAVAVRRAEEQRGDRVLAALAPKKEPPPPAARRQAQGAGLVLRDRRRRARRPERDLRLPRLVGAGAAARPRARVAEARRHRIPSTRRSASTPGRCWRRAAAGCASWTTSCCRSIGSPSTASRTTPECVRTTSSWTSTEADTGRTKLVGKGVFTGIYGATSVPGIKLHAEFAQAGDALTAVVAGGG